MATTAPRSRRLAAATLHEQLRESLRADILSGRYRPGGQIPTESEMISSYGVSKITVRRAIQDLASEGLLVGQRGRGTFVNPSKFAAAATLLFVHGSETPPQHPYTQMLINGVNSENGEAQRFRLELIARPFVESQSDDDDTVEQLVKHGRISGVIALPRLRKPQIQRLLDMGVSVAVIQRPFDELPEGMILVESGPTSPTDHQVRHVKEIGARRVGILTDQFLMPPTFVHQIHERMRAFGLPVIEDAFERADFGINDAHAAAARLLERFPDLDAIVAVDDLAALGCLHACYERNIRVPEQVAIIGRGNMLGEHSHCGITTVDTHIERHGKLAARTLLRVLAGDQVERHVQIEPTLLRRTTT